MGGCYDVGVKMERKRTIKKQKEQAAKLANDLVATLIKMGVEIKREKTKEFEPRTDIERIEDSITMELKREPYLITVSFADLIIHSKDAEEKRIEVRSNGPWQGEYQKFYALRKVEKFVPNGYSYSLHEENFKGSLEAYRISGSDKLPLLIVESNKEFEHWPSKSSPKGVTKKDLRKILETPLLLKFEPSDIKYFLASSDDLFTLDEPRGLLELGEDGRKLRESFREYNLLA